MICRVFSSYMRLLFFVLRNIYLEYFCYRRVLLDCVCCLVYVFFFINVGKGVFFNLELRRIVKSKSRKMRLLKYKLVRNFK